MRSKITYEKSSLAEGSMGRRVASLALGAVASAALLAGCNGRAEAAAPLSSDPRTAYVHLFEWSWSDIAEECENFLGPKGFSGVQISPPSEHIALDNWWARYQPVSYQLVSRSGDRAAFADMVQRCNAAGVEIYADLVINHTAAYGDGGVGTAGTSWSRKHHPMYGPQDYHDPCVIQNYGDAHEVRYCQLLTLPDLRTGSDYVQQTIADYINDMVGLGVSGFRIDAAKHMHPDDIAGIMGRVDGNPYFFSEVIDLGNEPIKASHYLHLGAVEEFKYSRDISSRFRSRDLAALHNFGNHADLIPGDQAVVFVDNHDNQRGHGAGGETITYHDGALYDLANVFMLAWPYGYPRLMSSFAFDKENETEMGPRVVRCTAGTGLTASAPIGCASIAGGRLRIWLASGERPVRRRCKTGGPAVATESPSLAVIAVSLSLTQAATS
ncbi:alpha-amylase family glycosyl hydrolase [Alkalilimnicola ehrlichii]|uniref:alpha-amylase family glycosyl hydrolase n=1 Tax=Alkalilimnicola ehrlichii TaxID=351052 RepID=UPI001C6EEE00|nr:alpha-amylase family glycosyl hydrolase [Alkalilimnicola ehrlichii]